MKCDFDTWEVREFDQCPCAEHEELRQARSWIVEVIADRSGEWCSNGLAFKLKSDAEAWGANLFMRWTAVREWRVSPSDRGPNR